MQHYVNLREEAAGEVPIHVGCGQSRSMAEAATFLMNLLGQVAAADSPKLVISTPNRIPPSAEFRTPLPHTPSVCSPHQRRHTNLRLSHQGVVLVEVHNPHPVGISQLADGVVS